MRKKLIPIIIIISRNELIDCMVSQSNEIIYEAKMTRFSNKAVQYSNISHAYEKTYDSSTWYFKTINIVLVCLLFLQTIL
jgi:hypothetical protein